MPVYGNARPQFTDSNGDPLLDGKLFIGIADEDPVANPNPNVKDLDGNTISSILTLDAVGVPSIPFQVSGDFSQAVFDKNGVEVTSYQIPRTSGFLLESDLIGVLGQGSDWNVGNTYAQHDYVRGTDGNYYISLTNSNLGNDPTVSSTSWSRLAWPTLFNISETYGLNDSCMTSDGRTYLSLVANNTNNDPTADDGTNWTIRRDISLTAIGTNTYIGTGFPIAPEDGQIFSVEFSNDNTGASTLDGIDIKLAGGVVDPLPGDILGGFITDLAFHTSPADHYEITNIKVTGLAHWPTVANSLGGDPLNDIDFSIGRIPDSLGTTIITSPALTKQIDAAWEAGSGVGGLFSGSVAIDTTYHLFEIFNPTTGVSDAGFSVFVNASDRPTGFSIYRRIASLYTDGSSNLLQFTQNGNEFYLNTPVIHYTDTTPGDSAVSVTAAVPVGLSVFVNITVKLHINSNVGVIVTDLAGVDIAPVFNGLSNLRTSSGVGTSSVVMSVSTNTLGQYRVRSSAAITFDVYLQFTMGWNDDRTQ